MKYDHNQICTKEKVVQVGQRYQYSEEGFIADVTVLEDLRNDDGIGFRLRIDNRVRWPDGGNDEFTCFAAHGHYAYGGMWRLHDEGAYA